MSKDLINKILEEIGLESISSQSENTKNEGSPAKTAHPEPTSDTKK